MAAAVVAVGRELGGNEIATLPDKIFDTLTELTEL